MTAGCPNRQRRHTPSSWTTPNPDTTLLGLYFQQPARLRGHFARIAAYSNAACDGRHEFGEYIFERAEHASVVIAKNYSRRASTRSAPRLKKAPRLPRL